MSDNPGSEDIFRLGVEVDTAGANASIDDMQRHIAALQERIQGAMRAGVREANEFWIDLREVSGALRDGVVDTRQAAKEIEQLATAYSTATEQAQRLAEAEAEAMRQSGSNGRGVVDPTVPLNPGELGYGVKGGGIGPAAPPGAAADESVGSLFGVGHALSVAGRATGSPILRDAGAFIYIEEGIRRVSVVMETLGAKAEAAGGVLPLVAEGLAGMGLSVGSLAIAVPLAGVAIAGVILAIKNYNDMLAEQQKHVQEAISKLDAYYKALESGTTESLEKDINRLEHHKRTVDTEQAQLIDARTNAATGSPEAVKVLAVLSGIYGDIDKKIEELGKDSVKTGAQIDGMKGALGSSGVVANDAAVASRKYAADLIETSNRYAEYDKMSTKQIQEKADTLRREGADAEFAANWIEQHNNQLALSPAEYEANIEAIQKYRAQAEQAKNDIDHLTGASADLAAKREEEIAALKATKLVLESIANAAKEAAAQASRIGDAIAGFNKAQSDAQTQLTNQTENARLREGQAEEQYHKGSIQDIYERSRIGLEEDRKELEAAQANADKIADVNLKLYEKQYEIGVNYQQQVQDDQTKLNNNLGKLAREGQYQQQEDQIDHQAKMAQLRERDIVADTQNLLDRNFKALYLAGLHKEQEARKEESDFAAKEAQQQRHRQQAASEAVIAAQQERQQQQVNYLRKMDDARRQAANEIVQADIAEQRKIQALRLAEQQKLIDLTTSENFKIQVLRKNLGNEIKLYEAQERQRIEIARTTMSVIIADALAQIAKIGTQNTAVNTGLGLAGGAFGALRNILFKDDGGSFGAGEPFMKGPITEGFDFGGGRGFALGGGSALVFPLRGGTATPQGGSSHRSITLAPTFNIYEATDIRRIKGQLLDMLDEVQN